MIGKALRVNKELFLSVWLDRDNTFKVFREFNFPAHISGSVMILDYNYIPWPRRDGNLLWG